MKTVLTIEESQRLIDLGVDPKMASKEPFIFNEIFTLTDILAILPKEIGNGYNLNIDITGAYYGAAYVCWDEDENGDAVIKDIRFDVIDPELIDALYKLLIWCIDNGHIKLKEK